MKKFILFISIFALTAISYFAQSSVDVSAQIRPRSQMLQKNFNSDLNANYFNELRTRLGVKFSPNKNITGFIQIQDSRVYGTEPNTLSSIDNLDLHQAYFSINNLFKLPINLKLGRFELSYGPQRLIGAVGWHNVGRSFDGGVLQLKRKNIDIDFFSAKTFESGLPGDSLDFGLIGAYGNLKMVKNYKIQPFVIAELMTDTDFSRYTVGVYVAGNIGNISHEIEGAYQLGSMNDEVDIAAFMFGLNLKYKFNSPMKPVVGLGVDYLSGDDGEDADQFKVFNTLYATNHKYYGFMDYFLNIPNHTYGLGLMDLQANAGFSPFNKFKSIIAFHVFNSNADFHLLNGNTSTSFGSEIDLTLIYLYNSSVKFQGGFSLFSPGDIFKQTKGEDSSTWGYLMAVVNL